MTFFIWQFPLPTGNSQAETYIVCLNQSPMEISSRHTWIVHYHKTLWFFFPFKCAFQNIPVMLILVQIQDKADGNFEFYSAFFYSSGGG